MAKREFTEKMGEISGFGGAYEEACRRMVLAGLDWLDAHPESDPKFHGFKGIYGIIEEDNDDAKELTKAVVAPVPDCSGAMHQASISHVMFIKKNGWDEYVRKMSEKSNGN